MLFSCPLQAQNDTFKCDATYYLSQYGVLGPGTTLYEVDFNASGVNFIISQSYNVYLNSIGFNKKDNLIYGFDPGDEDMYRMFADGSFQSLGMLPLPSGQGYFAADVDSSGTYVLGCGTPPYVVRVDVTGNNATKLSQFPLHYTTGTPGDPNFADFAFHPYDGVLYGFDHNTKQLSTIDPMTGEVNNFGPKELSASAGAMFFDAFGDLYTYGGGTLFKFDPQTGEASVESPGPAAPYKDGCSCPYTLQLEKMASADTACFGDTIQYFFTLANGTSMDISGVTIKDQLPQHLEIVDISSTLGGQILSGIGSNTLEIEDITVPKTTYFNTPSTFSIDVYIDSGITENSTIANQAIITNTPKFLGDTIISDDPTTGEFYDSTRIFINKTTYEYQNFAAEDTTVCLGSNVLLSTSFSPGVPHYWYGPNGYAGNKRTIEIQGIGPDEFGYYFVEADMGGCNKIIDSVLIEQKFDCDNGYGCGNELIHSYITNDSTYIGKIDMQAGGKLNLLAGFDMPLEALGHHPKHEVVYGFNNFDSSVYRLFSDGTVQSLGIPYPAITTNGAFEAGACDKEGRYYLTGSAGVIAEMDVSGSSANGVSSLQLSYSTGSGAPVFKDIVFHPNNGTCYGFDETTDRLCSIDVNTGLVETVGKEQPAVDIDAMYFDAMGNLYASGASGLYSVDIMLGEFNEIVNGIAHNKADGCSCPYDVKLWKSVNRTDACSGDTVLYEIMIANRLGSTIPGGILYDQLHPWLTITEINYSLPGNITGGSGVGTSYLLVNNMMIPEDTTSLKIEAVVDKNIPNDKVINNQALLFNLPGKFDSVWSDNPATYGVYDATSFYVYENVSSSTNLNLCQGDSFYAAGAWQTTPGNYVDKLTAATGCDSIVEFSLSFNETHYQALSLTICHSDSVLVGGQWRKTSGTYYDSLTNAFGCDSIIEMDLTVREKADTHLYFQICEGDSALIDGQWHYTAGSYYDTVQSARSCDSIVISHIDVSTSVIDSQFVSLCAGDSALLADAWVTEPGYYYDTLNTVPGCDSINVIKLTIDPLPEYERYVEVCEKDSFYVSDDWQSSSGIYRDTFPRANGCDSVTATNLKFVKELKSYIDTATCANVPVYLLGSWRDSSGIFSDTFTSVSGCDSIVRIELSVHTIKSDTLEISICEGDSIKLGNRYISTGGTYYDTLISSAGCDSLLALELTVVSTRFFNREEFLCPSDSISFGNKWIKKAGLYVDTFSAITGCDSVVSLDLHKYTEVSHTIDSAICNGNSIFFGNKQIGEPGTYYDTLTALHGCDSIIKLNLSVLQQPEGELLLDTLVCRGEEVHLYPGTFEKYKWSNGKATNEIIVDEPGTYSVTITASNGCTSADTVLVSVRNYPDPPLPNDTLKCPGKSITLIGSEEGRTTHRWSTGDTSRKITVSEPGDYRLVEDNGCESADTVSVMEYDTVAVDLRKDTIICKNDYVLLDASTLPGSSYQWSTGQQDAVIEAFEQGDYQVTVTDLHGCRSSDSFALTKFQCNESLSIPNAFSPNGDGANDVFDFNITDYKLLSVAIYNRWGERVFYSSGKHFNGWDGRKDGQIQPIGTYVVMVRYLTRYGEERISKGSLVLIK